MKRRLFELAGLELPTHRNFRDNLAVLLLSYEDPSSSVPSALKKQKRSSSGQPALKLARVETTSLSGHQLFQLAGEGEGRPRPRCKGCKAAGIEKRVSQMCRQCRIAFCFDHFIKHVK